MKEEILAKMKKEITMLKHELNVELPKEIGIAREHGDLKENAEYHAAKERQAYVRNRLEQLSERLGQLSMIDFSRIPRDRIGLGSSVTVLDLDTDEKITYELVIAEESDAAMKKISVSSPIGRALVNKKDQDEVEVRVPSGIREFEILSFETIYDKLSE